MARQKIMILIDSRRLSGPGRQILQIFEHINKHDFHLVLGVPVVGKDETELIHEASRVGVPLHVFRQRCSFDPFIVGKIQRKLREESVEILQTHGYKPCVLGFLLKLIGQWHWIHFMHGHTAEDLKVSIYFRLEFLLARFADRIVMVSNEMRNRLVAHGLPSKKTQTIHNAIDPGQFRKGSLPLFWEKFGITSRDRLIGVIGRLSPEKGTDVALAAFRIVEAMGIDIKLILVGEGPMEQELRQQVETYGLYGKVIFAGYQPFIADFYPRLDILVLPSRSEGLPNVVLEAMYFGVPIIATRVGGTDEIIVDGETGRLVLPDQPKALADAICELLGNMTLRESYVAKGKKICFENFSVRCRISRIENLYKEWNQTI